MLDESMGGLRVTFSESVLPRYAASRTAASGGWATRRPDDCHPGSRQATTIPAVLLQRQQWRLALRPGLRVRAASPAGGGRPPAQAAEQQPPPPAAAASAPGSSSLFPLQQPPPPAVRLPLRSSAKPPSTRPDRRPAIFPVQRHESGHVSGHPSPKTRVGACICRR